MLNNRFKDIAFTALLASFVVALPHLAVADDHTEKEKRAGETATRVSGDCLGVVKDVDTESMVKEIKKLNTAYFNGSKPAADRDRELNNLVKKLAGGDGQKEAVLRALMAQQIDVDAQRFVLDVALNGGDADKILAKQKKVIEGLGVPPDQVKEYVKQVRDRMAGPYESMKGAGFKFDATKGWVPANGDNHMEVSPEMFKKDPGLFTAVDMFFGPKTAQAMKEPRAVAEKGETSHTGEAASEATYTGEVVVTPGLKASAGKSEFTYDPQQVHVYGRGDYDKAVKKEMDAFEHAMDSYLRNSKQASTYMSLTKSGDGVKSPDEIKKNSAEQAFKTAYANLRYLGVPKNLSEGLENMMKTAYESDGRNLEAGIQKLVMARNATYSAMALPFVMWGAPALLAPRGAVMGGEGAFAGGQIISKGSMNVARLPFFGEVGFGTGLTTATTAESLAASSTTMAAVPLLWGMAGATINAGWDYHSKGGSFLCQLAENLVEHGSGSLYHAPFMAMIPYGVTAGQNFATWATGSKTWGFAAAGTANLGVAGYFVKQMVDAGYTSGTECYETIQKAKAAGESGDLATADALTDQAYKVCTQAGIDLGMAATMVGGTGIDAYKAIRDARAHPKAREMEVAETANRIGFAPKSGKTYLEGDLAKIREGLEKHGNDPVGAARLQSFDALVDLNKGAKDFKDLDMNQVRQLLAHNDWDAKAYENLAKVFEEAKTHLGEVKTADEALDMALRDPKRWSRKLTEEEIENLRKKCLKVR